MENFVLLTRADYERYLPIDVVAFAFAGGGAMGCPGGVNMCDSAGRVYSLNYLRDEWTGEELFRVCPSLKDCCFGVFDMEVRGDGDWRGEYLGCGNFLVVRSDFWDALMEKVEVNGGENVFLFAEWLRFIREIVEERWRYKRCF